MRRIEQKKYTELSELEPNRYTVRAFLFMSIGVAAIFFLNLIGVFHVNHWYMNIASGVAFTLFVAPKFIFYSDEMLSHHSVKYVLMGCALTSVLVLSLMLNFYAMIALSLPLFLTIYYPSKKLSLIATVGTLVIGFIMAPVSYLMGTWDVGYLAYLLSLISDIRKTVVMHYAPTLIDLLNITLYLSIPTTVIIGAFSIVTNKQVRVTIANRDNQLAVMSLSELDELTGALNRRCFHEAVNNIGKKNPKSVMIIYFDVNGLHELNNEKGHDAGDMLLRETAKELMKYYDEEQVFRLGGDEFAVILTDPDVQYESKNLELIRSYLEGESYYISYGMAAQPFPCDMEMLVRTAESRMIKNKALFYQNRGFDRRGRSVIGRSVYSYDRALDDMDGTQNQSTTSDDK